MDLIARVVLMLAVMISLPVASQGLPRAKSAEEVGMSSERLKRLGAVFKAEIDKGIAPGAVLLVARRGKVAYFEALGARDPQTADGMKTDAIFRLASMTKPFVSVAAMMLMEEGRLVLSDPVSRYLPEFKGMQVGVEQKSSTGETKLTLEPVKQEMTIQDLMRHTAGLTYGQFGGKTLVKAEYDKAGISSPDLTTPEFITRLSKIPLAHQPGTTWDYSVATDVLGRVIEVIEGRDLDTVIRERIARPLRLTDTGFSVPAENHGRIAESFIDKATGKRLIDRTITTPPKRFGGGGMMVASAADYVRFSQMLLNGGTLDGVRILSRTSVASMTANHLPASIIYSSYAYMIGASSPRPDMGQGWGLGFVVRTETGKNPWPGSAGSYYWNGATGTGFWVDPKEQLIAVMMVQAPAQQRLRALMRQGVYQAIID